MGLITGAPREKTSSFLMNYDKFIVPWLHIHVSPPNWLSNRFAVFTSNLIFIFPRLFKSFVIDTWSIFTKMIIREGHIPDQGLFDIWWYLRWLLLQISFPQSYLVELNQPQTPTGLSGLKLHSSNHPPTHSPGNNSTSFTNQNKSLTKMFIPVANNRH